MASSLHPRRDRPTGGPGPHGSQERWAPLGQVGQPEQRLAVAVVLGGREGVWKDTRPRERCRVAKTPHP